MSALLTLLGGSGTVWAALAAAVLASLGAGGVFTYRAGKRSVVTQADAARVKMVADAWAAQMKTPRDPTVLLRKHDV